MCIRDRRYSDCELNCSYPRPKPKCKNPQCPHTQPKCHASWHQAHENTAWNDATSTFTRDTAFQTQFCHRKAGQNSGCPAH
eukprot:3805063-Rhodomonas_salina.2